MNIPKATACPLCRAIDGHTALCITRIPDPATWAGPKRIIGPWNGPDLTNRSGPPAAGQSWFKLQAKADTSSADLWIYAEIGGWGITAEGLVSELAGLNVANITVHLNSPGGDVFDGIAIMNALRDHPGKITVKVDALAASIASVIAQAGDKVIMGRNSMMMIHNASGFAMGEGKDLRKMADLLDETTKNLASIYAERAGGDVAGWLAVMDEETWYTAEEAVGAGLADEVAALPSEQDARKAAAKFDLSVYNHAPALPVLEDQPEPEPEPLPAAVWDAAAFRASIAAAKPAPAVWDADLFRTAVALVTNDAPAPPPTPEPAPVAGFDFSMIGQAIREARS